MKIASYKISWRSLAVAVTLFLSVFLLGMYIGETRRATQKTGAPIGSL